MRKFIVIFTIIAGLSIQAGSAKNSGRVPLPGNKRINHISSLNNEEVNLNLKEENRSRIKLSQPVDKIQNKLFTSKEDELKYYLQAQKKLDIEDIRTLWESTVSRNPVIKFALRKLSLPADKRKLNSSRLARTISTLINGASMLPAFLGADSITSSASSATGGLASRLITKKSMPKEIPLTDTELIQLARLVEDLQDKIIKNYYAYKGNLEAYKAAKNNVIKYNSNYSQALASDNLTKIMTSRVLYNKALRTENELRQKIKLNRLQLERLAGIESVNKLKLGKVLLLGETPDMPMPGEKKDVVKEAVRKKEIKQVNNVSPVKTGKIDYADADVRTLAQEIGVELEEEKPDILGDLRIMWRAAVEKSETIRFAILKLSNPEGEIEKTNTVKKILSPLASVAPIVGMGFGDPVTAGSAMFGGGLLNSLISDDSKIKARLSKVTDADLVMLAQETDSLQEKLVILYYDYLNSIMELNAINKTVKDNEEFLNIVEETNPELALIANIFSEETLDKRFKARQDMLNKRVALEQFVGNDALLVVDKNLENRLN